jgi:hypothetical protein
MKKKCTPAANIPWPLTGRLENRGGRWFEDLAIREGYQEAFPHEVPLAEPINLLLPPRQGGNEFIRVSGVERKDRGGEGRSDAQLRP